jgi:hypothetical protein
MQVTKPIALTAEPGGWGLTEQEVEALRASGLKPEEISGGAEARDRRVRELLCWFVRLADGNANPKWTREHAFELAYHIATAERDAQ